MTALEICQVALGNLGITEPIASITAPTTKEERQCALHYPLAKKKLLAMAKWPFANRFEVLFEDASTTSTLYGYTYELPDDCVKARAIQPSRVDKTRVKYAIGVDSDGAEKRLMCDIGPVDSESPVLEYTANVSESLYPQEFCDALAWELASRIATPLRVAANNIKLAYQMSKIMAVEAGALQYNEEEPDSPPEASYILERG